jgi:general stress protein 26
MSVTMTGLLEFLRLHRYGVEATHAAEGAPQAALVGFVINERLELFFDSFDSTRKVANLRRDPRIALVIGGQTLGDERTVQYEGEVEELSAGPELDEFKRQYFAVLPDGLRRSRLPRITYFRVRPRWIRYSDLNVYPGEIAVFEGADLRIEDRSGPSATATPYTHLREPWQPRIEREAMFNAFANPRDSELENAPPLESLDVKPKEI